MAMLAAPHPSFSCFTKGTSSQTPAVCAARIKLEPQRHSIAPSLCGMRQRISVSLADCHDDQDQHGDSQDDEDQIALAEIAGGKISLGLICPRGELRQFLVVQ